VEFFDWRAGPPYTFWVQGQGQGLEVKAEGSGARAKASRLQMVLRLWSKNRKQKTENFFFEGGLTGSGVWVTKTGASRGGAVRRSAGLKPAAFRGLDALNGRSRVTGQGSQPG
jgi:hypothetical protein